MYFKNYDESKTQGLTHLAGFVQHEWTASFEKKIRMLEVGTGSRDGCLLRLSSDCRVRSMLTCFHECNYSNMKQWAYVAAKAEVMWLHMFPGESYLIEQLIWPLISDNEEVVDWYRQHRRPYDLEKNISGGDKDDPKSFMYYRYQSWLALNARWDELGERCERILAMQDQITKDRSYLIDHRFYLALAKGDKAGMEAVLLEKTTPTERKTRYDQESGLTNNFIVSYAVVFAKLAWRYGYHLEIDTPWIPKEWLPVQPLPKYEDPWPFMQKFDIWQPFEGEAAPSSPKKSA